MASLLLTARPAPQLLCSLAEALAVLLEQRHAAGEPCEYPPPGMAAEAPELGDGSCLGHGVAVCQRAAALATPMVAKRVLAAQVRLEAARGGGPASFKAPADAPAEARLVMLLEAVRIDEEGRAGRVAEAAALIPEAGPNPELQALLAREALTPPPPPLVLSGHAVSLTPY